MPHKATLAGVTVLAACLGLTALLVPESQVTPLLWVFVFLAVLASSLFAWSRAEAPVSPAVWIQYAGIALAGGATLAVVDGLIFGFAGGRWILDCALAVFGAVVCVGGSVHAAVKRWDDAA